MARRRSRLRLWLFALATLAFGYVALLYLLPLVAVVSASQLELLALDGRGHAATSTLPLIDGFGLVGSAPIVDLGERWRLGMATADAIAWGSAPTTNCLFQPHVGLELHHWGATTRVLLCFTCQLGQVVTNDLTIWGISGISRGSGPVFSRSLVAHGLPDLRR
ncbi:MAG: hypothetical protein ACYCWW_07705 [Deltaproteobacteria bacterium]